MPSKKINKEFVLSDSSVNVYGMRLLTSGYDMAEFKKNPIGYYGHKKEDGVLMKWENLRVVGDSIVGKPVINMGHPRAERTIKEIEEGFLNAASMGKLVIIDAELADNPEDPANPILVVTKWYNKECSLVDNPGNRNAIKVELYDGDDNELNLDDFRNSKFQIPNSKDENFKSHIPNSKNKDDMKKVTLELTPSLLGMLNLSDDKATAEAIAEGIEALHDENAALATAKEKAEQDLADTKAATVTARVKAILSKGIAEKKYTADTRNKLERAYAQMPDELEDLVKGMPVFEGVVDKIEKANARKLKRGLADKTWDELDLADELEALKQSDFELFKEKYKAKFRKEYKG